MDANTPLQPRWYTVKQAAAVLGYSVSKVKTLVGSGDLRSLKDGGSRRILPKWIDEYVESRAKAADADRMGLVT